MKKVLIFVISVFLFCQTLFPGNARADEFSEDEPFVGTFSASNAPLSEAPVIGAGAAIVMDMASSRVLYEKNAYTRMPMASTTKIMTAIVAIENGNLDDVVTVSKRAASIWGSTISLKEGEKIKLRELLYGLLLNSGNDAAIAIAEYIGGSVEGFLEMMNNKARELGTMDTSFKSPHGLDMDGHYTTAYDLAVITGYALKNATFSKIVGTKSTSIQGRSLYNTNEMLDIYPGADGVKTGYTGKAGRCLVTSVTRNSWRVISVVLNCPTRYVRAQSSKAILDYAFNNYKPYTLIKKGEKIKSIPVYKGIEKYVEVEAMEDVFVPLKTEEFDKVEVQIDVPLQVGAPVYSGVETGYMNFMLGDEIIGQTVLKTSSNVRKKEFRDYLGDIFGKWVRLVHEGIFDLD